MIAGKMKIHKILVADLQGNIYPISATQYNQEKHLFKKIKDIYMDEYGAENKMINESEGISKELKFEDAHVGENDY
ncbi:MAG: hypothetical protein ACUZ8E_01765 [Candidatus Anammoxibacter sp.]